MIIPIVRIIALIKTDTARIAIISVTIAFILLLTVPTVLLYAVLIALNLIPVQYVNISAITTKLKTMNTAIKYVKSVKPCFIMLADTQAPI